MQSISICGLIVPYAVDNVWSTSVYMGNETKNRRKGGRKTIRASPRIVFMYEIRRISRR